MMIRILMVWLSITLALAGPALAQGVVESLIGSGMSGFGGTGSKLLNSFTSPRFYGGSYDPSRAQYRRPGAAPQQAQGGGRSGNYRITPPSTPGIYPDWQGGRPTTSAPPVTYSAPRPDRQTAPQRRRTRAPAAQRNAQRAPVGAVRYSPAQRPLDVDQLPSGAVQVTTTTPQGTVVQYYAPPGETPPPPTPRYRDRRPRPRPASATAKPKPRTRGGSKATVQDTRGRQTGIAMPRPVEIPSGADPRSGWRVR
jgi:hypothetical protein